MREPYTRRPDHRNGLYFHERLRSADDRLWGNAAFAFAVTLLVISFDAIPDSAQAMLEALKGVPAFGASFALLVMFWWAHASWSRRYGLDDGVTAVLSCVLVFTVLVYVYPLRFMSEICITWIGHLTGLPVGRSGASTWPRPTPRPPSPRKASTA